MISLACETVMRDEKEGRKKQARSNKQQGKTTQHTQGSHFSKKMSFLGWDSNPQHSVRAHVYTLTCMYMHVYTCVYIAVTE